MDARWLAYWAIWRPVLAVAEVLAAFGVHRIGRHRILDHLLNLEASL